MSGVFPLELYNKSKPNSWKRKLVSFLEYAKYLVFLLAATNLILEIIGLIFPGSLSVCLASSVWTVLYCGFMMGEFIGSLFKIPEGCTKIADVLMDKKNIWPLIGLTLLITSLLVFPVGLGIFPSIIAMSVLSIFKAILISMNVMAAIVVPVTMCNSSIDQLIRNAEFINKENQRLLEKPSKLTENQEKSKEINPIAEPEKAKEHQLDEEITITNNL